MNAMLIEKEQIRNLTYPSRVSEKSGEQKSDLQQKCMKAQSLGNLHKVKCTIFFNDIEGLKKVYTTIWAYFEDSIVLKGGVSLNLRYIEDIVI